MCAAHHAPRHVISYHRVGSSFKGVRAHSTARSISFHLSGLRIIDLPLKQVCPCVHNCHLRVALVLCMPRVTDEWLKEITPPAVCGLLSARRRCTLSPARSLRCLAFPRSPNKEGAFAPGKYANKNVCEVSVLKSSEIQY